MNLPGSSTAETWPAQTQPRKIWSSSHSNTPWSAKAAGGSIVARSTGCLVSAMSRGSRSRRGSAACEGCVDLVVNLTISCVSMEALATADRALDVQARARAFAEDVLMPLEQEAEARGGRLPDETVAEVKRAAIEAGLNGGLHATEHGGQGWSRLEWVLVEEQFGRTTNAIHWHVPQAYNVWAHALRRADRPLSAPGASRRAQGRLRGDRARRGIRPVGDRSPPPSAPRPGSASTARSGSSPPATTPTSSSSWPT